MHLERRVFLFRIPKTKRHVTVSKAQRVVKSTKQKTYKKMRRNKHGRWLSPPFPQQEYLTTIN